jgi:hypothetical protein
LRYLIPISTFGIGGSTADAPRRDVLRKSSAASSVLILVVWVEWLAIPDFALDDRGYLTTLRRKK